jgi:SAM-dependent methyltransferase
MSIDGYVDSFAFENVCGWACDRTNAGLKLQVDLLVDGEIVRSTRADQQRLDLTEAGLPDCMFVFGDIRSIVPSGYTTVEIRCTNERVPLNNGIIDRGANPELGYANEWIRPDTLDDLNRRIHDGWPIERLYERAVHYHNIAFDVLSPDFTIPRAARILDVGSGVGWPMQAAMDRFPEAHLTGLDISNTMIERALERLNREKKYQTYEGRFEFRRYDGKAFPFTDDSFDIVYSYAVLWHIPDPILVRLLKEAARVLKPGGLAVLHFLDVKNLGDVYEREIDVQYGGKSGHQHHYRSPDQLLTIVGDFVGLGRIDLVAIDPYYWVCGEKSVLPKFKRPELAAAVAALQGAIRPRGGGRDA